MTFTRTRWRLLVAAVFVVVTATTGSRVAQGQLRWPDHKKEDIRLRLIALTLNLPRSTFYSSREVFVAEKDIGGEEWRLVKLVYEFLPYQPRLSEMGFDYTKVHELRAVRDPECDETVAKMPPPSSEVRYKYSTNSPAFHLDRRRAPLPCYETTADDYGGSVRGPEGEDAPQPKLKERR